MDRDIIGLQREDVAEGLAKMRELERQADVLKVLENDLRRFVGHLQGMYRVPAGYGIRDWTVGFEPAPAEQGEAEVGDGENGQ